MKDSSNDTKTLDLKEILKADAPDEALRDTPAEALVEMPHGEADLQDAASQDETPQSEDPRDDILLDDSLLDAVLLDETPAENAPQDGGLDDGALAEELAAARERMLGELRKVIVGQGEVVEQILLTLLAGGNSLIVGVPGLAKTLLVQTVAQVLDLDFSRIQFTPDLMPSDIVGTDLVQEDPASGERQMVFMCGPIFSNIVLADEINRTPPKTQAALLEAMQEQRVTIQGRTNDLPQPFHVFATQNPIELEGTYPLPEAQLDRFMFHIQIDHLPEEDELEVVKRTTQNLEPDLRYALDGPTLIAFQRLVRKVPVSDHVARYALALVRNTRPAEVGAADFIKKSVSYGASVRAAQYLVLGGKARALMRGRVHVSVDDIRALAHPVLRHRILTNFFAESEGITSDQLIDRLLETVKPPVSEL